MFNAVDKHGSNTIDLTEFLEMMALTTKERDPDEELIMAFKVLDYEGNGYISVAQLRHILSDFIEKDGHTTEVNKLISKIEENGQVKYEEFVNTMNVKETSDTGVILKK